MSFVFQFQVPVLVLGLKRVSHLRLYLPAGESDGRPLFRKEGSDEVEVPGN